MRFKIILALLCVLIGFHICDCDQSSFREADERAAIVQFFNYIDEVSNYTSRSIVDVLLQFFKKLYNSVPEEKHGPTAAEVKNFIDNLESAKAAGDTARMKEAAADFDNIEEKLLGNLMKEDREEIVIKQDSFQMIMMLRRVVEVSEVFLRKLNRAADALSARFTDEGFGRHERLFAVLTELKNIKITEGHRPDELLDQLSTIKSDYVV